MRLLLQHEGSANMEDSRGCFPLHLAAWNGHANICRILLTHGPSIAKVNEQVSPLLFPVAEVLLVKKVTGQAGIGLSKPWTSDKRHLSK